MTRPWWYDDENLDYGHDEGRDDEPDEPITCMECGHYIQDGEPAILERGYPPSQHEPGQAPYAAHEVCPVVCPECGERYAREDFGDEKEGARWTQAFCTDCGHAFNVPVW